jgi:hypothetical protein
MDRLSSSQLFLSVIAPQSIKLELLACCGCQTLAEIDNRPPDDMARLIDTQSRTPALVEEGQPVLPFVLTLTAFANAGNFAPAHKILNVG